MEFYFDHEKLEVEQLAIQFGAGSEILLEDCKGKAASAKKHLDEASSNIPNKTVDGNGKWSKKDRRKFVTVHGAEKTMTTKHTKYTKKDTKAEQRVVD